MNRLIEAIKENAAQLKQQAIAYFTFFFQGYYFYYGVGYFAFNYIKTNRIIGEPA